jgi:hypothetical protein
MFLMMHSSRKQQRQNSKQNWQSICAKIDGLKLTVPKAAQKAQCTQADIRRIMKRQLTDYTVQELIDLAQSFGLRVNVSVHVPQHSVH